VLLVLLLPDHLVVQELKLTVASTSVPLPTSTSTRLVLVLYPVLVVALQLLNCTLGTVLEFG
jgi:hypothetical protein